MDNNKIEIIIKIIKAKTKTKIQIHIKNSEEVNNNKEILTIATTIIEETLEDNNNKTLIIKEIIIINNNIIIRTTKMNKVDFNRKMGTKDRTDQILIIIEIIILIITIAINFRITKMTKIIKIKINFPVEMDNIIRIDLVIKEITFKINPGGTKEVVTKTPIKIEIICKDHKHLIETKTIITIIIETRDLIKVITTTRILIIIISIIILIITMMMVVWKTKKINFKINSKTKIKIFKITIKTIIREIKDKDLTNYVNLDKGAQNQVALEITLMEEL